MKVLPAFSRLSTLIVPPCSSTSCRTPAGVVKLSRVTTRCSGVCPAGGTTGCGLAHQLDNSPLKVGPPVREVRSMENSDGADPVRYRGIVDLREPRSHRRWRPLSGSRCAAVYDSKRGSTSSTSSRGIRRLLSARNTASSHGRLSNVRWPWNYRGSSRSDRDRRVEDCAEPVRVAQVRLEVINVGLERDVEERLIHAGVGQPARVGADLVPIAHGDCPVWAFDRLVGPRTQPAHHELESVDIATSPLRRLGPQSCSIFSRSSRCPHPQVGCDASVAQPESAWSGSSSRC